MSAIQWGSVADWFIGAGTFLAFGGTVWIISRDGKTRRSQQRDAEWDEAHKVTIGATPVGGPPTPEGKVTNLIGVSITNGGRRSIYSLQVTLILINVQQHRLLEDLPAERMETITFPWEDAAFDRNGFTGNVVVLFHDVSGRHWMTDISGRLYTPPGMPKSRWGKWRMNRKWKKLSNRSH